MSNNILISQIIRESMIEFTEFLSDNSNVQYLVGLIAESESYDELKDQWKLMYQDFELTSIVGKEDEIDSVFTQMVNLLKRKGCIEYSIESKPKSHLTCAIKSVEPSLDDPNLTMEQYISLTHSQDSRTRLATLRTMCPCKIKQDIDIVWNRIMEMASDPDRNVRYQAMHNICDGSPDRMEDSVISTLEDMDSKETDPKIRRKIHKILTHYQHTGKWNIM